MFTPVAWLVVVGCVGTPETTPCVRYEQAIDACADVAEQLLPDDATTVFLDGMDQACPAEEGLTDDEVEHYSCLEATWNDADCSTVEGLLELAALAGDC